MHAQYYNGFSSSREDDDTRGRNQDPIKLEALHYVQRTQPRTHTHSYTDTFMRA